MSMDSSKDYDDASDSEEEKRPMKWWAAIFMLINRFLIVDVFDNKFK